MGMLIAPPLRVAACTKGISLGKLSLCCCVIVAKHGLLLLPDSVHRVPCHQEGREGKQQASLPGLFELEVTLGLGHSRHWVVWADVFLLHSQSPDVVSVCGEHSCTSSFGIQSSPTSEKSRTCIMTHRGTEFKHGIIKQVGTGLKQ